MKLINTVYNTWHIAGITDFAITTDLQWDQVNAAAAATNSV